MPDDTSKWVDDFTEWSIIIVAILAMLPIIAVVALTALAALIVISPVVLIWWAVHVWQGRW